MTSEYTVIIQVAVGRGQKVAGSVRSCPLPPAPSYRYDAGSCSMVGGIMGCMKRQILSALIAAAVGSVALAQQAPAPSTETAQPPLTFRVEANFVEVDAFVSDASGKPVTDLRATDFQVLEDGQPQMVSAFSFVNMPIARAERPLFSPTAIEPDVDTNVGMDGRIYLFVLDDAHVDLTRGPRVKEALHRFFERNFGANDMAAVVFTG